MFIKYIDKPTTTSAMNVVDTKNYTKLFAESVKQEISIHNMTKILTSLDSFVAIILKTFDFYIQRTNVAGTFATFP